MVSREQGEPESEPTYAGGVDGALLLKWTEASPSFGDMSRLGDGNKGVSVLVCAW